MAMLAPSAASGYLVTPPKSLGELTASADLVVKARVVSDVPVTDGWFEPVQGFEPHEALLAVVSVIKGAPQSKPIRFRHYAPAQGGGPAWYEPPNVTFTLQRTYLVFASDAGGGVYRQLTKTPSMKHGEGVLLAGDGRPHRGKTITEAAWAELAALLASKAADDQTTAIRELDERSGGRGSSLADFARRPVLDLLRPMIATSTGDVQAEVVGAFGAHSPYTNDADAPFFFAGIGKGVIGGLSPRPIVRNTDAEVALQELTALADGSGSAEARARAIRALGRVAPPPPAGAAHAAAILRWFKDPEPRVRRAATLLAADTADATVINAAATDAPEAVRHGAARACGFAQDTALLPTLGALLHDAAQSVRTAAALSLLSFSPDDAGPVLSANLASDYRPLFINALARKDPSHHLTELAEVIEKDLRAADWWGGTIPSGDSWSILFDWVKKQPTTDLQQHKRDRSLDALEKLRWFGSSEPRNLYALYLLRGLDARAKRFRAACKSSVPFDMEDFFDQADKSPGTYVQP
jgi:HEAT repeat protein